MENAIYNSVILKPRTKMVGKAKVPLTDPQGVEVMQALMTVQYRMDKPGGGFKALEGMAITDGLVCRGGRSNSLAGGKDIMESYLKNQRKWFGANFKPRNMNEECGKDLCPATDLFVLLYKENSVFKRTTILKHVEGKHQFKELVDSMDGEEIEIINETDNSEVEGTSGGAGMFAALDIGEEIIEEVTMPENKESKQKRKSTEQLNKRERKLSKWETSSDIFKSSDESGNAYNGSYKESTPKSELTALREEVAQLKKENQALVNALNQAVKDKKCRKHCSRLQTTTSFLEKATEGYVLVEEAELRKLEAAAADKTVNKHGGELVTDWIERAHGLIIESINSKTE